MKDGKCACGFHIEMVLYVFMHHENASIWKRDMGWSMFHNKFSILLYPVVQKDKSSIKSTATSISLIWLIPYSPL